MTDTTGRTVGVPLPKTVFDLMNQRKGRFETTLNDKVEEIYLKLWEDSTFKRLLEGTNDSECVEGSESCDDHEAASMIRDHLRKENHVFGVKPLHSFKLALKVVMRRYRTSRKERRLTLGGQIVQEAAE
jgi:hypothetical protein